jgi:hypothetical protein
LLTGITDDGLIVGNATVNVTPLPGSLSMFAGGLAAFGLLGWFKARKQKVATMQAV